MIQPGQIIDNPITGERLVFLKTSQETNGELVEFEAFVKPTGFVASAHLHPYQEERFHVLRGTLDFKLGKSRLLAGPGERITVPAGTPHKFWNASEDEVHFVCQVRPALQFERLIATMYGLAFDGKTNRKGMPNPLRLAVIAHAHFDDVRLPFPPLWMQRMGLALGAPLGRLLGYEPTYLPSAEVAFETG
jgi:mannose-6-phosphate isomerase-like protein (cupin superfamily)